MNSECRCKSSTSIRISNDIQCTVQQWWFIITVIYMFVVVFFSYKLHYRPNRFHFKCQYFQHFYWQENQSAGYYSLSYICSDQTNDHGFCDYSNNTFPFPSIIWCFFCLWNNRHGTNLGLQQKMLTTHSPKYKSILYLLFPQQKFKLNIIN